MTVPKPPSPKEALEYMLDCFRDGIGSTDNESEAIADAKAAIPVADLHQEAVELLAIIINKDSGGIDAWWGANKSNIPILEKAHAIIKQLEALKCTPQK